MIQEKVRILEHKEVAHNCFKLILSSNYLSNNSSPGQFVMLKCGTTFEPLLRRPLSLHRIRPEHKIIEILYTVAGEGTSCLSKMEVNDEIDILGPLGNGFTIDKNKQTAILVGGGIGAAPLLALAEELKTRNSRLKTYVLLGAKTKNLVLCEKDFKDLGCEVIASTDDGTYGKKGFVSDILLEVINDHPETRDSRLVTLYTCGPKPMLKTIAEIALQKQIDCQISMEERMACGIGCCMGCAIQTKNGYKMVCKDGPVFNAKEIIWK